MLSDILDKCLREVQAEKSAPMVTPAPVAELVVGNAILEPSHDCLPGCLSCTSGTKQ